MDINGEKEKYLEILEKTNEICKIVIDRNFNLICGI